LKRPDRVEDYLEHIAQAIQRAMEYVERLGSATAFRQSQRDQDAVIRNIEIIGEAARLIQKNAPEFVTAHPETRALCRDAKVINLIFRCGHPYRGLQSKRATSVSKALGQRFAVRRTRARSRHAIGDSSWERRMIADISSRRDELREVCRRFQVRRLELFGSAARDDFDPARSDLDFLVEFQPVPVGAYADAFFGLKESLEQLFGRPVDLVAAAAIRNPYLGESVNRAKTLLYAA
jgi:uncharacterized protein